MRSARCAANIQLDHVSSSFRGAGGIFNSINCDATGSLPIEASSDLVLLCVNSGTYPGTVACSGSFVIPFQSMKAYSSLPIVSVKTDSDAVTVGLVWNFKCCRGAKLELQFEALAIDGWRFVR